MLIQLLNWLQEKWKPVAGYEGLYDVSSTGRVRSLTRYILIANGTKRKQKGRILKPRPNQDGYLSVILAKPGLLKTKYVHRLVAEAFIENPLDKPEINHLNGLKQDNRVENICWATREENMRHCYETGLCKQLGGNHYYAVGVIDKELGQTFDTIADWADARGIPHSTARNILSGRQQSKRIDLTAIFRQNKKKENG